MLIEIKRLRSYFEDDTVFVTEHAAERFRQRGIKISDIRNAVNTGEIIEQYPSSYSSALAELQSIGIFLLLQLEKLFHNQKQNFQ